MVLFLGLFATPVGAAVVTWDLSGVVFEDGATAWGSFDYDAFTDSYADWNITVTGGILSPYTYQPGVDGGFLGIHDATMADFVAFPPGTSGRYIRLVFMSPLTDAGGTIALDTDLAGLFSWECGNCFPLRRIVAGEVTTELVPEPSSWLLVAAGLGLSGALGRRRADR
jgi:hypothetical protein